MDSDGPLYRRWWKVWPIPRCCLACNVVLHPCRASVSQNKTRFRQDGFDLDLTYVTSRIIVHGFPATGVEHIYRNPRTEVQRLLDKYHRGHYKVYNFASEAGRTYPEHIFEGRVERYPFADHTCPRLDSVVNFCENAKAWLDMDEQNVVSLHCKAGKGRAGIMAACLLVRLGETASEAVAKFDSTRVSDLKGLTVVNQRKWPFMYERLVKEVWGVHNSIGMVPGEDPDLRAPAPRAACLREISIQLDLPTAGKRRVRSFLPSLSCAVYQQEPMGKTLVHRARLVEAAPQEGEPESVFAAVLPRSVVVQGTFQVLVSAAVRRASTQKNVMDLWWNTTFLEANGGDHAFGLSEMDVSPLRLAGKLQLANAKLVVQHTHPHAESPRRRPPLRSRASSATSILAGAAAAPKRQSAAGGGGVSAPETEARGPIAPGGGVESDASQLSPPNGSQRLVAPAKEGGGNVNSKGGDGVGVNETTAPAAVSSTGGDSAGRDVFNTAGGVAVETSGSQRGAVSLGDSANLHASEANHKDSLAGSSPALALPGPSPAGMVSPVWTFEGRTPSTVDPSGRAIGDSRWTRRKMWMSSRGGSSGGASTPARGSSHNAALASRDQKPRDMTGAPQCRSRSMDSMGHSAGSNTSAPTGTSSSMRGGWGGGGCKGGPVPPRGKATATANVFQHRKPRGESESSSDDQLAIGASAFEGGSSGAQRQMAGPSFVDGQQWAMEMELAFYHERSRWEEHQLELEAALDFALAARARAEARSEEDSARVEVLEERLAAWRNEYSAIERDVKQAVKLLEISLSGLMSAETALKRWKGQIPPKAYDDILGCLTTGESTVGDKE